MATTEWKTITRDGKRWLIIPMAELHVPLDWDPSSQVMIAVAAPSAAAIANIPALVKGDDGPSPTFLEQIDFTALAYDDPTADFARLEEVAPATKTTGAVYRVVMGLHKGPAGDDGTTSIDLNSITGGIGFRKVIQVKSSLDGFEFVSQKVGDRYIPASLNSTAQGNANSTLGVVAIPPQEFDWRPDTRAQGVVQPTGPNIRVDLLARLNGEINGNVVGRGIGIAGVTQNIAITAGPPPGSADSYDRVAAGQAATVHLRVERQSGSDTFTTAAAMTYFGGVRVQPIL